MTVHLLLCDAFDGLLTPTFPSYPRMFEELFNAVRPGLTYRVFPVYAGTVPSFSDQAISREDLFVVTGSRAGVYEALPWFEPLAAFIRAAHKRKAKTAGVCFGHQMLAHALGGKVEKAAEKRGDGILSARTFGTRTAERFPGASFNLVYSHEDQVVRLPAEAENFATADHCPFAGFHIGSHILTFQGHPEFTPEFSRYLLEEHDDGLSEAEKKAALGSLNLPTHHREAARWMLALA